MGLVRIDPLEAFPDIIGGKFWEFPRCGPDGMTDCGTPFPIRVILRPAHRIVTAHLLLDR
jgi:hypothetical protein